MNEREKNASIEYILSNGLVKPQAARVRIAEMIRTLGLRFIFWDTGYSLFFAAVTVSGTVALFCLVPDSYRLSSAVATAPLLFLLVTLFTETSEQAHGLYGLKQACHYSIRQIIAIRILCYSVVGAVFTAAVSAVSAESLSEYLSLFPLCLSALFLCAVISLSILRFTGNKWADAVFSAVWVGSNLALPFLFGKRWEAMLGRVPVALSVTLAVIGIVIFVYQISKMLSEVKNYALA